MGCVFWNVGGKIKSNAEYESSEANEQAGEREYFLKKIISKLIPSGGGKILSIFN